MDTSLGDALVALTKIMFLNVVLSGDNAVVIALACRRLSPTHQRLAFIWGSAGVVVLMIGLTGVVAYLLTLPYLEIVGSLLLLWIGIKLLVAEDEGEEGGVEQKDTLMAAIRTIIIADMVMSLDNVLAMAAIAQGHMWMLVVGLVITVPVILFGSALLMKLMDRYPIFILIGAGLIGWVAGEMVLGDPVITGWLKANPPAREWMDAHAVHWIVPALGAALVIGVGKAKELLQKRKGADIALP